MLLLFSEPQVRSIASNVRPDRQSKLSSCDCFSLNLLVTCLQFFFSLILPSALLFSATFKKKVEMLCRDILTDPIRVVVGELGEVRTNSLPPIVVSSEENNSVNCGLLLFSELVNKLNQPCRMLRKTHVGT